MNTRLMADQSSPTDTALSCPTCESQETEVFFKLDDMPVHVGRLFPTRASALACPRGNIHLGYCQQCGMVWNTSFDPDVMQYDGEYDNSLFFSPLHRQHAQESAQRLIQKHGIRNKEVVEIGCGSGEFLGLLCELGENRGIGFDPSCDANANPPRGVTFVQDLFDERYADRQGDLVCSRYVFEHVHEPIAFLKQLHQTLRNNPASLVYFEVPNSALIFDEGLVWDVIYEHYAHFCQLSLARAFESADFGVCAVGEGYDGQVLWIEGRPAKSGADVLPASTWDDRARLTPKVESFSEDFRQTLSVWQTRLDEYRQRGQTVVAWGAGAKGISFLNMLTVGDLVQHVVDINPRKAGHFLPCTGQEIVGLSDLKSIAPDVVLVMNPMYEAEIREMLKQQSLAPEIVCV